MKKNNICFMSFNPLKNIKLKRNDLKLHSHSSPIQFSGQPVISNNLNC